MSFARIIGLVLASLFIGISALNAQDSIKPGGDGGVVILPKAPASLALTNSSFTSNDSQTQTQTQTPTQAPEPGDSGEDLGDVTPDEDLLHDVDQVEEPDPDTGLDTDETIPVRMRISFSLVDDDQEDDKIQLALPLEMANAYAVMLAGEQRVEMSVLVVAGHLELDLDVFRALRELSVSEAKIILATVTNFLVIEVEIDLDRNTVTFTII